ncbi:permease prefix domain 1-containing protein [Cellulosimicrobium marinum]|uniref:permease prefix domain 1-containing protein n=1 Tax=Cellulosimicrobium marinum TaxID=1638992 RepID=UPI001E2D2AA7|nr:permease prefix domain 1-containing protein [Cellulosimicrobium marinum]MCB7135737.1 permease prefix domain 1-containing protein [Cellulosimicrobium marinum]
MTAAGAGGANPGPHAALEVQIDQWRGYVRRREAISTADVDEMEDHLRERVEDLRATGLDDDEAFLVAVKRMGDLDSVSREFAREHSDRLWKQLVLVRDTPGDGTRSWRELAVVLALAVGAGVAVKVATVVAPDETVLLRNASLLVLPFLGAYLAWKRRLTWAVGLGLLAVAAATGVVLNVYPFASPSSTEVLAALHAPVLLWALVGVAYVGGRWRSGPRRMDFARFTGELAIYLALLALGGGVLLGLTAAVFSLAGVDLEPSLESWILPFCVPGALVVAAWLVEAKQDVVENIAPVLTRVFTPLTVVMLVAVFVVLATAGDLADVDRELLILMDAILVLVLALLLYSVSARDPLAPPSFFDGLQLGLVGLALAVDAVALTAMLSRIAEFGVSPNKAVALVLNVLLLVHLAGSALLSLGFLRRRRPFDALARWQTSFLPVYAVWAAVVVVVVPPVFGFV